LNLLFSCLNLTCARIIDMCNQSQVVCFLMSFFLKYKKYFILKPNMLSAFNYIINIYTSGYILLYVTTMTNFGLKWGNKFNPTVWFTIIYFIDIFSSKILSLSFDVSVVWIFVSPLKFMWKFHL
jgi:hypothetical protein